MRDETAKSELARTKSLRESLGPRAETPYTGGFRTDIPRVWGLCHFPASRLPIRAMQAGCRALVSTAQAAPLSEGSEPNRVFRLHAPRCRSSDCPRPNGILSVSRARFSHHGETVAARCALFGASRTVSVMALIGEPPVLPWAKVCSYGGTRGSSRVQASQGIPDHGGP